MTHGSLFEGYGGLRRGLEDAGMETLWTRDLIYGHDVKQERANGLPRVDCISGGPPCQETSHAASFSRQRTGVSLWPHMLRIVEMLRPSWVLVEQPLGGRNIIVRTAQSLQWIGYGCAARIIDSQHWVPQRRARWFLVARMGITGMALWNQLYPHSERVERGEQAINGKPYSGEIAQQSIRYLGPCPDCMRGGIFARVSARRIALMGAGNAVTQPVAQWIGERILQAEEGLK